jgi:hypothetical protein
MHYWLFDFFRGTNLTYSINDNSTDTNIVEVTQGVNLVNFTKDFIVVIILLFFINLG